MTLSTFCRHPGNISVLKRSRGDIQGFGGDGNHMFTKEVQLHVRSPSMSQLDCFSSECDSAVRCHCDLSACCVPCTYVTPPCEQGLLALSHRGLQCSTGVPLRHVTPGGGTHSYLYAKPLVSGTFPVRPGLLTALRGLVEGMCVIKARPKSMHLNSHGYFLITERTFESNFEETLISQRRHPHHEY